MNNFEKIDTKLSEMVSQIEAMQEIIEPLILAPSPFILITKGGWKIYSSLQDEQLRKKYDLIKEMHESMHFNGWEAQDMKVAIRQVRQLLRRMERDYANPPGRDATG